jgi:hypothetical protein
MFGALIKGQTRFTGFDDKIISMYGVYAQLHICD